MYRSFLFSEPETTMVHSDAKCFVYFFHCLYLMSAFIALKPLIDHQH